MKIIDILNKYDRYHKCFIFGAGKYAQLLIKYIIKHKSSEITQNIVVSSKNNNPDKIENIRVIDLHNLDDVCGDILIAVSYEKQEEIYNYLIQCGFAENFIIRLTASDLYDIEKENFSSVCVGKKDIRMVGIVVQDRLIDWQNLKLRY